MKRLIKKAESSVLFIVDVQKEFIQFVPEKIFDGIKQYINSQQWSKIIVIVDDNKSECSIPDWMKNSSTQIIHKRYWGVSDDSIYKDISKGDAVQKGKGFRYDDGHLVVDTDNAHDTFSVPKQLEEVAKTISNAILVGGASDECLEDVETALKYLGVNATINNSLTYSAKDKYDDTSWKDKEKWIKV